MKLIDNFFRAFTVQDNIMFVISTIIVATFTVIVSAMLVIFAGAYIAATIGPQVFLAIPILAFIRVGYAAWTGK